MSGRAFHLQSPTTPPAAGVADQPPGPQSPGVQEVMDADFFADATAWQKIVTEHWDFIVVGSGCTALAFADAACAKDPRARILVLERGPFWLTQHFQNTPLPFKYVLGGLSETKPWTLAQATIDSPFQFMHGSCPFLGGRSNFWSAWSPSPTPALMRDWPPELVEPTQQPGFWESASELLNVITADQIGDPVYAELQEQIDNRLPANLSRYVPTAQEAYPAPLAVGNPESIDVRFEKFSVPGPLLALKEAHDDDVTGAALEIVTRCVVQRLSGDGGTVTEIETSRGPLPVGNARIVLAAGAVPPATLLMNSFPDLVPLAGTRLCAHFLTHIAARIPRAAFTALPDYLQIAAMYVAGLGSTGRQYHVQVTAIASPHAEQDAVDAARECPDYAAAATAEQLAGSEDYVVFVCATLGETDETNPDNWVRFDGGPDPTDNVTLQMVPSSADNELWDEMDVATVGVIEAMADAGGGLPPIEYWHPGIDTQGSWSTEPLSPAERRIPGLVHEAGPLFMGTSPQDSVTGPDFRPWGLANVYVTGAALFPTSGSWNPTLTMCGLAQTLANRLTEASLAARTDRS